MITTTPELLVEEVREMYGIDRYSQEGVCKRYRTRRKNGS